MKLTHWTAGLGVIAAVSLLGLVDADASAFRLAILSDDLSNVVHGDPKTGAWADSGPSQSGLETGERGVPPAPVVKDNNGHGNNIDGVDSSNKGQGEGGPTGGLDESCSGTGTCIDDEKGTEPVSTEPVSTKTSDGKQK